MPKVNCNPIKLAKCHAYFQRSRTAHNLKELEKQLVAASSISGMQVKGQAAPYYVMISKLTVLP